MNVTRSLILLFLVMPMSVCISAGKDPIKQLLDSGRAQEAYSSALQRIDKEEGDPYFDYLYGLAAIGAGHPDLAVFALERVVLAQPKHYRARLELGRAYYQIDDYAASMGEFKYVLSRNPPENVKIRINIFLNKIKQKQNDLKTKYTADFDITHGYDSNINSATSNSTVQVPSVGSVLLNASSKGSSGYFREMLFKADMRHALSKKKGVFASFSLEDRNNMGSTAFDTLSAAVKGGYALLRNDDRYELSLQYQELYLAGDRIQKLPALNVQWARKIDALNSLTSFAQYALLRYPATRTRNVDLSLMGGIWMKNIPSRKMLLSVSAYYADERAKYASGSQNGREYLGVRTGLHWLKNSKQSVYGALAFQQADHKAADPVFAVQRDDRFIQLIVGSSWKLSKAWTVKAEMDITNNNSNIALYDYKRNQAYFTLHYKIR